MTDSSTAVLRLIGLGVRGRLVVSRCGAGAGGGAREQLRLAVVASDASPNSRDKIVPLLIGARYYYD